MTNLTVSRRESFEAAHFLRDYPGPCSKMHGHRWDVEVGVEASVNPGTGMAIDFNKIKAFLRQEVVDRFDHRCLNELMDDPPTAENIAIYVQQRLYETFGKSWKFVKVWESPNSYVKISN